MLNYSTLARNIIPRHLVLGWQHAESLLQSDSLSRVLVIWGESGGVGGFGNLAVTGDLLQSVDSLAVRAQSVHQMHFWRRWL